MVIQFFFERGSAEIMGRNNTEGAGHLVWVSKAICQPKEEIIEFNFYFSDIREITIFDKEYNSKPL